MYCCDVPSAMAAVAGLTVIDIRTGEVTVKVVEPEMDPEAAVIVVAPCLRLVANPPLLMVATVGTLDIHVTELVKFCVVPSLYVPVAVNC